MNRKRMLAIVAFVVLIAFVFVYSKVDEQKAKEAAQSKADNTVQATSYAASPRIGIL